MRKTIEAFLRGVIGFIPGLLPAKLLFDNIILMLIVAGFFGILSERILPFFLSTKASDDTNIKNVKTISSKNIKSLILFLIISLSCSIMGFNIYMTYDKYNYGQKLKVVSFTNVKMTAKPFFNDKSNKLVRVLNASETVIYLTKEPRRLSRQTNLKYYLDFWRKVKTSKGDEGWVYGAYLEKSLE